MNLFDVGIALTALSAGWVGYRCGFMARVLSWCGLVGGAVVGVVLVDDIANMLRGSTPRTRLIASLAFIVLVGAIGQMLGMAIGAWLRRRLLRHGMVSLPDHVAGVAVVLACVWLLVPALASASGWPARAVRGSVIMRAIDRWAPAPPSSVATLGRLVGDAPFPQVFDRLVSPDAGSPPTVGLSAGVSARVRASVVKIEGRACDQIQQGSGFVVAENLVVTNAHVVAGERATEVVAPDGRRLPAVVVAFDPNRDLAVLRVNGLALVPLTRADGTVDVTGAVIGYPGGGPEDESPARVAQQIIAKGTNIYRDAKTTRDVFVLAARLMPGDSGGPLVDDHGRVIGLAFAVDPSNPTTAYALTDDEVTRGLSGTSTSGGAVAVDTGMCLVG